MDVHFAVSKPAVIDGVRAAIRGTGGRLVVIGGDSVVASVADAVIGERAGEECLIGLIPVGRRANLARTFGLSGEPAESLARLAGAAPYPIDVAVMTSSSGRTLVVNDVLLGFAAARGPRMLRRVAVTVQTDRRRIEVTAMAAVVANGQFALGGRGVAPRATVVDGVLDVQLLAGGIRDLAVIGRRIRRGLHTAHTSVRRTTGSHVQLETSHPWPVRADGKLRGITPVAIDSFPAAIRLAI